MTTELNSWKALQLHYDTVGKHLNLNQLFAEDPERFDTLSATFGTIGHSSLPLMLLDYSKNIVTKETMSLLMNLVKEAQVDAWRDRMFHGEKINTTYALLSL